MATLIYAIPSLAHALSQALLESHQTDLAEQVSSAEIIDVSYDEDAGAASVYVQPTKSLNIVEQNIIGARHARSVPIDTPFDTVLDLDNFGRITSIEILAPGAIAESLKTLIRSLSKAGGDAGR
jgi:hypothetical protein